VLWGGEQGGGNERVLQEEGIHTKVVLRCGICKGCREIKEIKRQDEIRPRIRGLASMNIVQEPSTVTPKGCYSEA